jgi:hypothetical protein
MTDPEPNTLGRIVRELPRKRVALVLLVVVVNVGLVTWIRGCGIGRVRSAAVPRINLSVFCSGGFGGCIAHAQPWPCPGAAVRNPVATISVPTTHFVPPWQWTTHEWRETLQWK